MDAVTFRIMPEDVLGRPASGDSINDLLGDQAQQNVARYVAELPRADLAAGTLEPSAAAASAASKMSAWSTWWCLARLRDISGLISLTRTYLPAGRRRPRPRTFPEASQREIDEDSCQWFRQWR